MFDHKGLITRDRGFPLIHLQLNRVGVKDRLGIQRRVLTLMAKGIFVRVPGFPLGSSRAFTSGLKNASYCLILILGPVFIVSLSRYVRSIFHFAGQDVVCTRISGNNVFISRFYPRLLHVGVHGAARNSFNVVGGNACTFKERVGQEVSGCYSNKDTGQLAKVCLPYFVHVAVHPRRVKRWRDTIDLGLRKGACQRRNLIRPVCGREEDLVRFSYLRSSPGEVYLVRSRAARRLQRRNKQLRDGRFVISVNFELRGTRVRGLIRDVHHVTLKIVLS